MSPIENKRGPVPSEESTGHIKTEINLSNGLELSVRCYPEDMRSLARFKNYLNRVAAGAAHLFFITPESHDDFFDTEAGENVFLLPNSYFYRAYLVVAGDKHQKSADFLDLEEIEFNSFPAAPFLRGEESLADFLFLVSEKLKGRVMLLRGDTVQKVWDGRFDDTNNYFLFNNPPPGGRIFGRLFTTTEEWREEIYPQSLSFKAIAKHFDWLDPKIESFDDLWQQAHKFLSPSPEQLRLDLKYS